jgi:hypothetical protein
MSPRSGGATEITPCTPPFIRVRTWTSGSPPSPSWTTGMLALWCALGIAVNFTSRRPLEPFIGPVPVGRAENAWSGWMAVLPSNTCFGSTGNDSRSGGL